MNTPSDDTFVNLASETVDRATGLALQADSASAARELERIPRSAFDVETATFRDCMIQRFGLDGAAPSDFGIDDPWVGDLVRAYVNYWQQVLTKSATIDAAEVDLQMAVGILLDRPLVENNLLDEVEMEIQNEIAKRGFHALLGRTAPLRELMLWREQSISQEDVKLPEGTFRVTVTCLNDFVLRGWGHYATCGRRSAGGWTTEEGLFAVVPAYKRLDDEEFSVRFLAHEAQHFADKQAFENLESWELEYRAKLTELALADTSLASTLKLFCENRSDRSKDAPHAYANFSVIRDLEQRLTRQHSHVELCGGRVDDGQVIRDVAKALLVEDSGHRSYLAGKEEIET
jgi:hypothetical protein